jgi:hypothetical protein
MEMARLNNALIAAAVTVTCMLGVGPVSAEVNLLRGAGAETVAETAADALPSVLRGNSGLSPVVAREIPPPRRAKKTRTEFAAGEVVWLSRDGGRRLVACYLRGNGYVGEMRIVCTDRK